MLKFLITAVLQSISLATAQVFLKVAMNKAGNFEWTLSFFKSMANWALGVSVAGFGLATLLWFQILKNSDFSLAYPVSSISYIFGMLASVIILNESIPTTRWIGVIFIVIGVFFMVKQ